MVKINDVVRTNRTPDRLKKAAKTVQKRIASRKAAFLKELESATASLLRLNDPKLVAGLLTIGGRQTPNLQRLETMPSVGPKMI